MDRPGLGKEPLLVFKKIFCRFFDFWQPFTVFKHFKPKILEIPGVSGKDLPMWAAVLGDFPIPSRRTNSDCKIIFEQSQQIWDIFTNMAACLR